MSTTALSVVGTPPRSSRRAGPPGRPAKARRGAAPPRGAPIRLTRRGRVVLGLVAAVVAFAGLAGGREGARAAAPAPAATLVAVTVQPGDTLWGIAERAAPDEDPRAVIARIARANGLTASGLVAGQELLVPTPVGQSP